jgi:hypothetical protein
MKPKKQNAQMMQIMDFTKADLALNKKGELSEDQIDSHYRVRSALHKDMSDINEKGLIVIELLRWAFMYAVLVITGIFQMIEDVLGVLTVPTFTAIMVLYMTYRQRRHMEAMAILRKLADPNQPISPVSVAEGQITKCVEHKMDSKFAHQEYVLIAGRKIRVMPESLDVLDEETIYRFYYLDHNGVDMFLSAEVVNKNTPKSS